MTNKAVTSSDCLISCALTEMSDTNPGCVYARFVKAHVKRSDFHHMMTTHNAKVSEVRQEKARRAAVAQLREAEGEAVPADEQEANQLVRDRQKENQKENASAAGSAPKKPRVADARMADARFRAPRGLTFPKGQAMSDVRADDPRVVWETKQIYMHLVQVFRRDGAAIKMDELTAANTVPSFLTKIKTLWHHTFPAYTNAPREAMLAALRAFWLAKRPAH